MHISALRSPPPPSAGWPAPISGVLNRRYTHLSLHLDHHDSASHQPAMADPPTPPHMARELGLSALFVLTGERNVSARRAG